MSDPSLAVAGVEAAPISTSLTSPPFTMGKVVGRTFRVFGRNVVRFGLVALVLFAPAILVELAAQGAAEDAGVWRLITGLWNVLGCLVTAAVTRGTLDVLEGRTAHASAMFGAGFGRGLRVLGASILVSLITVLGLALVVAPGLIAAAGLYVTSAVVAAEPERSVSASIERSWSLTRGHRWAMLGVAVLFVAFPLAIVLVQGGVTEAVGPAGARAAAGLGGVAMTLALTLQAVAAATAYHALRAEKEGLAPAHLGAVFE